MARRGAGGVVAGAQAKKNSVAGAFASAKAEGRAALVLYVTGAYPDRERFPQVIRAMAEYADVIEIGIPFSDPLADGPTIQAASEHVLGQGTTTDNIFDLLETISSEVDTPFVAMGYWNTILRYGAAAYAARCEKAGIRGVIVADLTPEEAAPWQSVAESHGIETIFLVAPTTPADRIGFIAQRSSGFVYMVSLLGVTGARDVLPAELTDFVARARAATDRPLAVGFGVSTPDQVAHIARLADGVIIGSALIRQIDPAESVDQECDRIRAFLAPLRESLKIKAT